MLFNAAKTAKIITVAANNDIKRQFRIFLFVSFLLASCKFIISSFSEIAFNSSAFSSEKNAYGGFERFRYGDEHIGVGD